MDQPINFPKYWSRRTTGRIATIGGQSGYQEGATAYPAYSFVKLSSGKLVPIATGEATAFGAFDYYPSTGLNAATPVVPPYNLLAAHWPFELDKGQFLLNITDGSGNVGQANSAPTLSSVSVGSQYGCYVWTSGANKGICALNGADTTNKCFTIVDIPLRVYPGSILTASTTYNGLVVVEVIPSLIQPLG